MSKVCTKCSKSVYPIEELKCLDKIWHKSCFKCTECGMSLNMKNYKGYDKNPYCSAHYPQTKATVVADTPEIQRLTQNTKIQSQVKYHEEFEKKIKGSKIQVADDPESQRLRQVSSVISQVEYKGMKETRRQSLPQTSEARSSLLSDSSSQQDDVYKPSPYNRRNTAHSVAYSADGKVVESGRQLRIGSIADYDPVNENYGSLTQGYRPTSTSSQSQEWEETLPVSPTQQSIHESLKAAQGDQKDTQTNTNHQDEDELFQIESNVAENKESQDNGDHIKDVTQDEAIESVDNEDELNSKTEIDNQEEFSNKTAKQGAVYVALYEYDAQDEDEVGFAENDHILECDVIDEGWMYGTVERTGQRGMLPSNYVELLQ